MKKILILLGMILSTCFVFAKEKIVITSIQPLYSITKYVTKGTDIKVYNPFGSDVSMTMTKEKIHEPEFDLEIAKKAQAVIDIARVWPEDTIFAAARNKNINIIEIDASFPYDENLSPLFFTDFPNGKVNYYVWTGNKNILRMANIVAKDLTKIYPKDKKTIEKNLVNLSNRLRTLEVVLNNKMLNAKTTEVISLSPNIQYFLNDMNLYVESVDYSSVTADNVAKIMDDTGIKIFVSDRWLKRKVVKAIKAAGGKFIVINTLDIPLDLDEKMDPDGLLKAYEENANAIIDALSKEDVQESK